MVLILSLTEECPLTAAAVGSVFAMVICSYSVNRRVQKNKKNEKSDLAYVMETPNYPPSHREPSITK
jgi:hypothetical protein